MHEFFNHACHVNQELDLLVLFLIENSPPDLNLLGVAWEISFTRTNICAVQLLIFEHLNCWLVLLCSLVSLMPGTYLSSVKGAFDASWSLSSGKQNKWSYPVEQKKVTQFIISVVGTWQDTTSCHVKTTSTQSCRSKEKATGAWNVPRNIRLGRWRWAPLAGLKYGPIMDA